MMNTTPVFVLGSIGIQNGGLTKAAFIRANLLSKKSEEVPLLTLNFHRNLDEIKDEQYKNGNINEKVKIFNMYKDLDPKNTLKVRDQTQKLYKKNFNAINTTYFRDKASSVEAYRIFKDGLYSKYIRLDEKQRIISIDYFDESWVRLRQEIFDEYGYLVKTRHMDRSKNKPKLDRYFSRDGSCFLTVSVNPNTGANIKFYLHQSTLKRNVKNKISKTPIMSTEFNENGIFVYWINKKIKNIDNPAIMCEKREQVDVFAKLKHPNLKRYYILHNNHFAYPHIKGAPVDPSCAPLFSNLDIFEKVILLTEEQKRDIVEQFGNADKFEVISHVAEKVEDTNVKLKPHHAVSMARYAPQKSLHEAIHAFKYVVDEIPDATYSIYGYGELKDELQKLINELNLEKNVFLEGFSLNALENYQESVCQILTSKYEGLPLCILESLAAGTPLVSYRSKYGPEDVIRHGVDGFLVDIGDRKGLASYIIKLMKDEELYKTLSKNGRSVVERFNNEDYENKWLNLF